MKYLEFLYKRYGLKIWLTEFSCGDSAQGKPTSAHLAYMRQIVPLLDASPFVYRYSWMSAHDGKGIRGLVSNGQLTELGNLYNSL